MNLFDFRPFAILLAYSRIFLTGVNTTADHQTIPFVSSCGRVTAKE